MAQYRYRDAQGTTDDIIVIEDHSIYMKGCSGRWEPGFEFIDGHTVRAHPLIIDTLLLDAEPLWSIDEVLADALSD